MLFLVVRPNCRRLWALSMTSDLPITLAVNQQISSAFSHMPFVGEKLAAQLNFQTLTAGWYGNEQDVLKVHLCIVSKQQLTSKCDAPEHQQKLTVFADDVISYYQQSKQQITCYVAITDIEQKQLLATAKLSKIYMHTKLTKVLNLIAKQRGLPLI